MPLDPRYLATAIDAALVAGRLQRRFFRQDPDVRKKGPIDLVTEADIAVETELRRLIGERFPSHVILAEEGARTDAPAAGPPRWIIDPLDGTTNFAHGLALFCVSIALEIDGRVELGVVHDPMAGELFTAERGEGARCNGVPLRVSGCEQLIDALLCTGFPYTIRDDREDQVEVFSAFLGRARAVRRLGSAALDLCYVAAGRLDGFWEARLQPWDVAAGGLIVEEAGGVVSDYSGRAVDLSRGQVVACTPHLHAELLAVLGSGRSEGRR